MINAALMGEIHALIEEHPERHRQETWLSNLYGLAPYVPVEVIRPWAHRDVPVVPEDPARPVCGTAACVAGWAVILSAPDGAETSGYYVDLPGGETTDMPTLAQEYLGLGDGQRRYLFSAERTREEMLDALEYLPAHPDADELELAAMCGDDAGQFDGWDDEDEDDE